MVRPTWRKKRQRVSSGTAGHESHVICNSKDEHEPLLPLIALFSTRRMQENDAAAGAAQSVGECSARVSSAKPKREPKVIPGSNIGHPKFNPTYIARGAASPLSSAKGWITPLSAPAYFPLDAFHAALREQAIHPEQNSALILRAESMRVVPSDEDEVDDKLAEELGCSLNERQLFRFLPRQARRDAAMEQRHASYSNPDKYGLILKTPEVESAASMPYYHPPVRKLAFVWEGNGDLDGVPDDATDGARIYGTLYVCYLPFEDLPPSESDMLAPPSKPPRRRSPLAGSSSTSETVKPPATVLEDDTPEAREQARVVAERRLQRTCLALLERLHKHGHGVGNGYVKRVHHDVSSLPLPF